SGKVVDPITPKILNRQRDNSRTKIVSPAKILFQPLRIMRARYFSSYGYWLMHYLSPEFALIFIGFLWLYWWVGSSWGVRAQNNLLLLASYLFYCSFNWRFALLLFNFSFVILLLAQAVETPDGTRRRWPVVLGVVIALLNL